MLSSRTGPWSSSTSLNAKDTMRGSRKSSRACGGEEDRGEEDRWRGGQVEHDGGGRGEGGKGIKVGGG